MTEKDQMPGLQDTGSLYGCCLSCNIITQIIDVNKSFLITSEVDLVSLK